MLQFLLEFQRKIIDFSGVFDAISFGVSSDHRTKPEFWARSSRVNFGVLLDAITCGVRIFFIQFLFEFRRKFIDFGVLFDAISFGVWSD